MEYIYFVQHRMLLLSLCKCLFYIKSLHIRYDDDPFVLNIIFTSVLETYGKTTISDY